MPFKKAMTLVTAVLFSLALCACGGESSDSVQTGEVINATLLGAFTPQSLEEYLDRAIEETGIETELWESIKSELTRNFKYDIAAYSVAYTTMNTAGKVVNASGLAVLPVQGAAPAVEIPMFSFQRPMQVERKYSPSMSIEYDPELTVPVALALASTGYVVACADSLGMGINYDTNPYCQLAQGWAVVDMIKASGELAGTYGENIVWDERIFMAGYSEGGYASMAAARDIQLNHAGELEVSAVAALGGPYSLSKSMKQVMLGAGPGYPSPYFLPYFLAGYEASYGSEDTIFQDQRTDEFDFTRDVVNQVPDYTPPQGSDYALELYKLLNGEHSSEEINGFMKLATPWQGPRSILTPAALDDLEDGASDMCSILAQNDAFHDWVPEMPFKIFHCLFDDVVPVENAREAYDYFKAHGAKDNVELEEFILYLPGLGSVHVGAAPVAYLLGFEYLDTIAYPERNQDQ